MSPISSRPLYSPTPLVSVVVPTRNGSYHLRPCIESVLAQDYPNIELIVVDGDSTDATEEILLSYGDRLRYVSEPDRGQSHAVNKGMAMATGQILAWINDDDEYLPGAIARAVLALAETDADLVYGDALALDGWGRRYGQRVNVRPGGLTTFLEDGCFIVQPASFWRREVFEKAGPLREDLHYALDYDFFMKAARDFDLVYVPYTFAIERLHAGAKTYTGQRVRIDEMWQAATANGATALPRGFRSEAAAIYTLDALRSMRRHDWTEARAALRQARQWWRPIGRYVGFLAGTGLAGGRGLPRLRLLQNLAVSRRRDRANPYHDQPPVPRYRFRARLDQTIAQAEEASGFRNRVIRLGGRVIRPRLGVLDQHPPRPLHAAAPLAPTPISAEVQLPTMTVVTPSFNQRRFLPTTVSSVLDQEYPGLEYIVRDGGSTDGSAEFLATLDDPRLRWSSQPDGGQAAAINDGHRAGTGEIMAWLNSDDIFLPGTLRYVGAFFATNPHVDVVYSHRVLIDGEGDEIGRWVLPAHDDDALKWADYVPQETLFWRRRLWARVGGLDDSFRFAMDWDLLLRFSEADATMVRLPIFGGGFRVHPDQLTSSKLDTLGAEEIRRLRRRCHGREVSSSEVASALAPYLARHVVLDRAWRAGLVPYTG